MPDNPDSNERERKNDEMRMEWSRHYDTLLWHVITIFTAGVGALLGLSFHDKISRWPEIGGVTLTFLGVFYVASFRSFRENLHDGINNPYFKAFFKNPTPHVWLHQWEVFVMSFVVIDGVFIYNLARKTNCFWIVLVCCLIIMGLVLCPLYMMGKSKEIR